MTMMKTSEIPEGEDFVFLWGLCCLYYVPPLLFLRQPFLALLGSLRGTSGSRSGSHLGTPRFELLRRLGCIRFSPLCQTGLMCRTLAGCGRAFNDRYLILMGWIASDRFKALWPIIRRDGQSIIEISLRLSFDDQIQAEERIYSMTGIGDMEYFFKLSAGEFMSAERIVNVCQPVLPQRSKCEAAISFFYSGRSFARRIGEGLPIQSVA